MLQKCVPSAPRRLRSGVQVGKKGLGHAGVPWRHPGGSIKYAGGEATRKEVDWVGDINVQVTDAWVAFGAVGVSETLEWGRGGTLTALGGPPEVEKEQCGRQTPRYPARTDPWHLLVFRSLCNSLPLNVGRSQDWLLPRRITLFQSGGTFWWTEKIWVGRSSSCPKRKKVSWRLTGVRGAPRAEGPTPPTGQQTHTRGIPP